MIEFRVKMEAPSTPNLREHHMVRAKRVKSQRGAVSRVMPKWPDTEPLLHVRITRVAARALDKDNVQGAMKGVRDQIASGLRIDDASPLVEWHYAQAKGEAEVVVQIWEKGEEAPPVPTQEAQTLTGRQRCDKNGCKGLLPCSQHTPYVPPGEWTKEKVEAFNHALPDGRRLRSPPRSGAKAGNLNYVEAYTPPRSISVGKRCSKGCGNHGWDTTSERTWFCSDCGQPPEHVPVDAAKEAEATFAPGECDCVGQHTVECIQKGAL